MIRREAPANGDVCKDLCIMLISDVNEHMTSKADRNKASIQFGFKYILSRRHLRTKVGYPRQFTRTYGKRRQ